MCCEGSGGVGLRGMSGEKEKELAVRVLEACRNRLFFRWRFLEQALFRLKWLEWDGFLPGSDGESFYYNRKYVLERYMEDEAEISLDYLHTVIHCLYRHPFFPGETRAVYWDLAADMAVECVLEELAAGAAEARRREVMTELKEQIGIMSVRKIYLFLQEKKGQEVEELAGLFKRDDHSLWYAGGLEGQKQWADAAGRVLMAARVFQEPGQIPGSLLRNLGKLVREEQDYMAFLQKFAGHMEERMQVDQEEFDYVFYTYGLRLFGKVPLIEPLEYRERRMIREFVIAIDTSASCQGELVERFLTKTCNILLQARAFAPEARVHIIQCDACIQEHSKVCSARDLEAYLASLVLKGFGGTDFTPVFDYVDRMLGSGELQGPDGLIYFTDGYGRFPERAPGYRTAFVFLDRAEEVGVPSWAMKVYLDEEVLA